MRKTQKQNPRRPHLAIGHRRGAISTSPSNVRPQPRAIQRVRRRDGGPVVKVGIETIPVAYLCPSKLAIALHRQLLSLMDSHPETFPPLSMCVRTHRSDHSLVVAYGDDRHMVSLEDARSYLLRILGGHTGRHDEPSED